MKDLIAKLHLDANCALGAIWMHIDAQAARIAELEAQIAAESAPANTNELREAIHKLQFEDAETDYKDGYNRGVRAAADIASTALQAPVREVPEPIQWTYGPNVWKDWCSHYFGPDSDDTYLAEAVFNLPPMAQKFKTQWISVEERLPEVRDDSVLALFNHGGIDMVHLQEYFGDLTNGYSDAGEQLYTQLYKSVGITHWCALPAAPVQTEGE